MPQKYELQLIPICVGNMLTASTKPTDDLRLFKRTYDAFNELGLEERNLTLYIYRNSKTISKQELEEDCSSNYPPAAD